MAYCPQCGSSHIQLQQNQNVNWGRAVAGWALFGVVGGAVGAVTGDDRHSNVCMDCGTAWKAADLYKSKQTFKALTQKDLDLQYKDDRFLLNKFMAQISPYLQAIPKEEENTQKLLKEKENNKVENQSVGCAFGLMLGIGGCVTLASADGGAAFMCFLIFSILGWGIGFLLDLARSQQVEKEIEQLKLERERVKRRTEKELEMKVKEFIADHSLS